MKLTLSEIRAIIRRALNEAPLEDILPFKVSRAVRSNPLEDAEYIQTYKPDGTEDDMVPAGEWRAKNKEKVRRYFETPKFKADAVRLYKNLSVPIYVIPAYEKGFTGDQRAEPISGKPAVRALQQLGMNEEQIEDFQAKLASGATIWVVKAGILERGFWPSPWMCVHAMFDQGQTNDFDALGYSEISEILSQIDFHLTGDAWDIPGVRDVFSKCLTMKSARDKEIASIGDGTSEILTQAILTRDGFVFKPFGDPVVDEKLSEIKKIADRARPKFEALVRGKLVVVDAAKEI